jgi:hypothetical protein
MINIKIPISTLILSGVWFYFGGKMFFSVGDLINKFYPCKQPLDNSFPCQEMYNIYFLFFLGVVFIISLIFIIIQLLTKKK